MTSILLWTAFSLLLTVGSFMPYDEFIELSYGISNGCCTFEDSDFLSKVCQFKNPYGSMMPVIDRILRSDRNTSDSCHRFHNVHIPDEESYDYIVVGGGVGGAAMAGILCKKYKVLLIEAGPEEPTCTTVPTYFMDALNSDLDWHYVTVVQSEACKGTNFVCNWPRGKMLSGTSGMSGSMYTRGSPQIFDQWVAEGCNGWGYAELLEYFKKSERNLDLDDIETEFHGTEGVNVVSHCPFKKDLVELFLRAGNEMGYETIDVCGKKQEGFTRAQLMIKDGQRASTNRLYLRPERKNPNLTVLLNALATKLIIDPKTMRATAVQYLDRAKNLKIAKVRREVILSGGVIGSPQLLMLSGIGPKYHLMDLGIDVLLDLPVGLFLQHHVSVAVHFYLDVDTNKRPTELDDVLEYVANKTGPLASTGITQVTAFIRSSFAQSGVPDLQIFFDGDNESCSCVSKTDDKCADPERNACKRYFTARPTFLMSESFGYMKLQSKNPQEHPLIQPNYLHHPRDIAALVEGIEFVEALLNTPTLKSIGAEIDSEPVKGCENLEFASYEYNVCKIKAGTGPENHHSGTCKMGRPDDPTAVVDLDLRVIGTQNIRVVDASVFRFQPNGNPIATIIAFAEKICDHILQEASQCD